MSHGLAAQARKGHDGKVGDKEVKGEQWMALQEWALFLGSPIHKHSQPGDRRAPGGHSLCPPPRASTFMRPINGVVMAVDRSQHGSLSPRPI